MEFRPYSAFSWSVSSWSWQSISSKGSSTEMHVTWKIFSSGSKSLKCIVCKQHTWRIKPSQRNEMDASIFNPNLHPSHLHFPFPFPKSNHPLWNYSWKPLFPVLWTHLPHHSQHLLPLQNRWYFLGYEGTRWNILKKFQSEGVLETNKGISCGEVCDLECDFVGVTSFFGS